MGKIQLFLAVFALVVLVVTIASTFNAVWQNFDNVDNYLRLTELVLSWPVVASTLVFGGATAMIDAFQGRSGK